MKVLVTGGLGFQGSNLCSLLLRDGHEVTILNTLSERSKQNIERFNLQKCTIVWGSITDNQLVYKVVRDHDLIYHLAANIHVDESLENPRIYYETNVLGTLNVVEACRKPKIPLIHVSSCEVYGGCEMCSSASCTNTIKETCCFKPKSPYAGSKAAADALVYAHAISYCIPTIIVRPGNIFGPGQRYGTRGAVIPIFTKLALENSPITINGDGAQTRDFVSVASLVKAYTQLIDHIPTENKPLVLNLTSNCEISIRSIAEKIIKASHSNSKITFGIPRPGEVQGFNLSTDKIKSKGIHLSYNFDCAIEDYISWFRKYEMEDQLCPL